MPDYAVVAPDGTVLNVVATDVSTHFASWESCLGACGRDAAHHWPKPAGTIIAAMTAVKVDPITVKVLDKATSQPADMSKLTADSTKTITDSGTKVSAGGAKG